MHVVAHNETDSRSRVLVIHKHHLLVMAGKEAQQQYLFPGNVRGLAGDQAFHYF